MKTSFEKKTNGLVALSVKIEKEELEKIKYDPLKIAEIELDSGILPISVRKPMPSKKEDKLKRVKEGKIDDKKIKEKENETEEEIAVEGEIMELATPEDEVTEEVENEGDED